MLVGTSAAGLVGWFTSETRDWEFVQQTGGLRIGAPIEKEGRRVLPVEYDVRGLTIVTRKPTTMNSGLAVRRIEVVAKGGHIVLQVVTQVFEKNSVAGPLHYADLSGVPAGSFEVFYGVAGDAEKRLGRIEIK